MKRGEIWWARLDKKRPIVLVSRAEAYEVRAMVIAVPVSTTIRGFAVEVRVGKSEGLPKTGVVNCDWLVTVPKADLLKRAGTLSKAKVEQLDDALKFALGLNG